MNIPDAAIYATIAPGTVFIAWAIRMAVRENRGRRVIQQKAGEPMMVQLSARDWIEIVRSIQKEFNGRYLLAEEWRDAMRDLNQKLEGNSLLISNLHEELRELKS